MQGRRLYLCININKWEIEISYQNGEFLHENSKAFYRSTLATAIVMALSAPAFAADNAVSTTPVTLDKDKTTLEQDVVISGTTQITAATINAKDKDLNVTLGGHDITATSTVDQGFVEGVKVSGDKNVVINATGSTITAQGEGTYVRTAMVIDSTGDVVVNGGNFVAKNEKVVRQVYLWKRPRK